jgi:hypothetical protein
MCKYIYKINITASLYLVITLAFLLLVPYDIPAAAQLDGSELKPLPLPNYKKGTTFIYSDGTWETVAANSPGRVTWRNYRGNVSSGSPDFTYRRAQWQGKNSKIFREFAPRKDIFFKHAVTLWPLRKGNISSFSELRTRVDEEGVVKSSKAAWTCQVVGTEKVSVMAGEFDTWKIVCKRYPGKVSSKSRIREVKTWYYAPEVGHYVLTTSKYYYHKKPRRLELLAVVPSLDGLSASAQRRMETTFQKAMEFKKSGESLSWSLPDTALSGEITPTGTFKLADGRFCRRYIQKVKFADGHRIYHGMAVRDSDGVWVMPRRR